MKYNIAIFMQILAMTAFMTACEPSGDNELPADATVNMSLTVPASLAAGSDDLASSRMRFIVEVSDGPVPVYRTETVRPVGTSSIDIDFQLQEGSYTYMVWADYIEASAASDAASGYADRYYNTDDLKSISVIEPSSLIDNDACEAFYASGTIAKKPERAALEVALVCPFTRIAVGDHDAEGLSRIKSVSFPYDLPVTFDASEGAVSGSRPGTYTNDAYVPDASGDLFTMYMLTGPDGGTMGKMRMTLGTVDGVSQDFEIPEIPLKRGKNMPVTGNFVDKIENPDVEFKIEYGLDVDDWQSEDVNLGGGTEPGPDVDVNVDYDLDVDDWESEDVEL